MSPVIVWAVALYITAAYWFTSSKSFANPAITVARSLRIRSLFVIAQLLGAALGTLPADGCSLADCGAHTRYGRS